MATTANVEGDQPIAPNSAKEGTRLSSLDFIRGIAVMGILAANIVAFGQPFSAYMFPESFLVPPGDPGGWLWITQLVLVDGKMRGLFSLLFGAGMYLFMEKAWEKGLDRRLQFKRLCWLLVFGLIHFYLIWRGDILTYYAIVGMVALLCLRWSAKTQLVVGLLGYLVGAIMLAGMMVPMYFVAETPFGEQPAFAEMRENAEEQKAHALDDDKVDTGLKTAGNYGGLIAHRFDTHLEDPLVGIVMFFFETFPLMLLGIALYRFGLFSGGMDPGRMRLWGWIGVLAGGLCHLAIGLWVKAAGFSYWSTLAGMMGMTVLPRLAMVLGLAALFSLYGPRATGWLGQRVSAAGRSAFTNYLGTSIVMMFVFHGWALGLFGQLNRPQLYLVVLLAWVLMLLWSKPWLERFRYGPLEWLWRCLTYGRVFALRR
ncbi:DUF418 domain-containing protein [Erythrobacter sp. SDW2]|uniref:DUF418 domain-containing protein n=1 Tax=Erythrobacter sp. SDW2 TaxID=2907154 RepID=UPI001F2A1D2E|nr:DUF418 domain-containing protein [Erythrobacter sp. SDW2]UIP06619.1 DUF418 domain-containing protein [Erythrobacter sp. SDW2]